MEVSIIVARSKNGVIGVNNELPWHLSDDLKFFKKHTTGKPIIMGRKTFDSIGRPLPKRTNIVISRNADLKLEGAIVVSDLQQAIAQAQQENPEEVFIIGGAQIYQIALSAATKLYLTEVDTVLEGDAHFPEVDLNQWKEVFRERHPSDEKHNFPFDWVILEKG